MSIVGRSKSDHHRLHNSTFSLESHFNYNHATFLMMRRIPALLLYKKVEMWWTNWPISNFQMKCMSKSKVKMNSRRNKKFYTSGLKRFKKNLFYRVSQQVLERDLVKKIFQNQKRRNIRESLFTLLSRSDLPLIWRIFWQKVSKFTNLRFSIQNLLSHPVLA